MKQIHIEKINDTIESIMECYINNDVEGLLENISYLGEQIQPISKEITPILAEIISTYKAAAKPIIEQLVTELIKTAKYGLLTGANILESTLEEHKKYEEALAKTRAIELIALISAGFTREESMSILLTRMIKTNTSNITNKLPKINIKNKEKTEELK